MNSGIFNRKFKIPAISNPTFKSSRIRIICEMPTVPPLYSPVGTRNQFNPPQNKKKPAAF